jgi:4-hydroxy-tetrahydrodipicolinate reductase
MERPHEEFSGEEARAMRLLIVGYGKMGRMVEELAVAEGVEIVGRVDQGRDEWADADVAVDFSTADALLSNFTHYTKRRLPAVIGTTGWNAHFDRLREEAARAGIGIVASGNFSIGVNVFANVVAEATRLMIAQPQYGAWIHEIHHSAKRDAPSGTALLLRDAMVAAGFNRSIDISSARAGMIPGTHTVGFDSASDTIELIHRARDRRGFASGAMLAARWIQGRTGWFTMQDVLKG